MIPSLEFGTDGAGFMPLTVFTPSRPLRRYVKAIWDYQDLTGDESAALTILPDTTIYLCFLYADTLQTRHKDRVYTTRSGLAGFQTFRSDLGGIGTISGVSACLTAWGLNAFHSGIAKDCAERRVECREIFPRYAIEKLEDTLARAPSAAARVEHVEGFLLSALGQHDEDLLIAAACDALNALDERCSIGDLARSLDVTERTLERRFRSQIGTTPKRYSRVIRLRKAILRRKSGASWADAAYATGYYDQSHMIRDFQALYGLSPKDISAGIRASTTLRFSGLLNLHPETSHPAS